LALGLCHSKRAWKSDWNHLILSPTLSRGEGVVNSLAPLPPGEAGVWDEHEKILF